MNIILICLAIKYDGDWDKIYQALENKEKVTIEQMQEVEKALELQKIQVITILDQNYPMHLKSAFKPPFVLWLQGNIKLLNNQFLCATGNQSDDLTVKRVNKFLPEIEKTHVLINGNFKGLDQIILAKRTKGMLFISACGFKHSNFKAREQDLLVSEYPNQVKPSPNLFRQRNRLIAAFSENLILFSSKRNGPINHLVSSFLNQGKEIYCFAGDGSSEDGNSELIKQGANLITSIKDLTN